MQLLFPYFKLACHPLTFHVYPNYIMVDIMYILVSYRGGDMDSQCPYTDVLMVVGICP